MARAKKTKADKTELQEQTNGKIRRKGQKDNYIRVVDGKEEVKEFGEITGCCGLRLSFHGGKAPTEEFYEKEAAAKMESNTIRN